jgi:hypothetical protein
MRLEKWALIAEILGAASVVATLVVLILQVGENTAAIKAASRQSAATRIEERTMSVATSPQLADLIFRAGNSGDIQLDSGEALQLLNYYQSLLTSTEESYFQFREGNLDQEFFEARARRSLRGISGPFTEPVFESFFGDGVYTEEFVEWLREFRSQNAPSEGDE